MARRAAIRGSAPSAPNEQSISCQNQGMPRSVPKISANGTSIPQAIRPKSTTHTLARGSRRGPMNATAITRCANASQSVA